MRWWNGGWCGEEGKFSKRAVRRLVCSAGSVSVPSSHHPAQTHRPPRLLCAHCARGYLFVLYLLCLILSRAAVFAQNRARGDGS